MIATQPATKQVMDACIGQWRAAIVERDDAGLLDQIRDIESAARMLHSVMLETVAEIESRNELARHARAFDPTSLCLRSAGSPGPRRSAPPPPGNRHI